MNAARQVKGIAAGTSSTNTKKISELHMGKERCWLRAFSASVDEQSPTLFPEKRYFRACPREVSSPLSLGFQDLGVGEFHNQLQTEGYKSCLSYLLSTVLPPVTHSPAVHIEL
ncbi:hypothetical protein L6164_030372 [Bauhinia variegata]|uniref:Uncharacterized protein n=1 Tax=Bauhinia variegata TaxID=167791 RepID=A0ACB9LC87_BAUVA|nr:hypothetical protein L6164_030372 [Bauhinia variegata]